MINNPAKQRSGALTWCFAGVIGWTVVVAWVPIVAGVVLRLASEIDPLANLMPLGLVNRLVAVPGWTPPLSWDAPKLEADGAACGFGVLVWLDDTLVLSAVRAIQIL
jgi:hypothetical protein